MAKLLNFIETRQKKLLWLAIAFYFITFSLICLWKYFQFGYNGLDLAILNQVFFNSAQGNLFQFSVHPGSYLGDHFELIIPLLLPLYLIFRHPLALLTLQTLILALTALPIFLIAKNVLAKPWPLVIALIWLLNPFVQNINLFEFHILPFAVFFILLAFYFYQQNNFKAWLLFCFLALLVREDVALVIFMFSILSLLDKRSWGWVIWPAAISAIWFLAAIKVIGYFTPSGSYKFLYYYSWLGSTAKEIIINFFAQPLNTLKHVFSINNLLFTIVLFLPFGFLSLIKFRYLILALPIYLQIILGGSTNSVIALKLHYASLFLPALFIALIYGLKVIQKWRYRDLLIISLLVGTVYGFLTLGPILGVAKNLVAGWPNKESLAIKKDFVKTIPPSTSLATTYEFLTSLSSRPKLYSLHYGFIGKKQFTDIDYRLPDDLETILIDFDDLLTYGVQFPNSQQWQAYYGQGDDNLRKLIEEQGFKVSKIADSFVILDKSSGLGVNLYETGIFNDIQNEQPVKIDDKIEFLGFSQGLTLNSGHNLLPITLYFKALQPMAENYQLRLIIKNKNGQTVHSKVYPLAYGLYPTSEWQADEMVKINYWFLIPDNLSENNYQIDFELLSYKGYLTLNHLRSAVMEITQEKILKPTVNLTNYSHY